MSRLTRHSKQLSGKFGRDQVVPSRNPHGTQASVPGPLRVFATLQPYLHVPRNDLAVLTP